MYKYEDIVREWSSRKIQTVYDIDTILNNYRILFAYHSNKIEGSSVSMHQTREIFENGKVVNYTGDLRELFEVQNQKNCYEFLKQHILEKTPITPQLICKIQESLMNGCYDETRWCKGERPGEYKKNYYGVGENAGVLPEDVPDEMEYICNEINSVTSKESTHILSVAAYLHCNFENIHPFADGNGRVGRTLMNYFLMTHDMPPLIVHNEDKEAYYMGLALFDATEKLDGFVQFLKEQTVKTWVNNNPIKKRKTKNIHLCL